MRFFLASRSPRRRQILDMMGIRHKVVPADVDETMEEGESPAQAVARISALKAGTAAAELEADGIVIAADTVVVFEGLVFGKPRDEAAAVRMLSMLSGNWHDVYTGLSVFGAGKDGHVLRITDCVRTRVHFRELDGGEIESYVATGEPLDKAGAYGIQELGLMLIDRIEGDFYNVMGLPACRLAEILKSDFGYNVLQHATQKFRR